MKKLFLGTSLVITSLFVSAQITHAEMMDRLHLVEQKR